MQKSRVFYVGEGEDFEGSEDGGRTWKTFTRCKVVEYGGVAYVWAPPGKSWAWKTMAVKLPYVDGNNELKTDKLVLRRNRSFPVVVGEGPSDSYLDLSAEEVKACMRASDSEGLVLERNYNPADYKTAEQLLAEAERLRAAAEKKLGIQGSTTEPKASRPRKASRSEL